MSLTKNLWTLDPDVPNVGAVDANAPLASLVETRTHEKVNISARRGEPGAVEEPDRTRADYCNLSELSGPHVRSQFCQLKTTRPENGQPQESGRRCVSKPDW